MHQGYKWWIKVLRIEDSMLRFASNNLQVGELQVLDFHFDFWTLVLDFGLVSTFKSQL
jgi:hypothetical protein